jgi:hypothetical protein
MITVACRGCSYILHCLIICENLMMSRRLCGKGPRMLIRHVLMVRRRFTSLQNYSTVVGLLIKAKASVDQAYDDGATPLCIAARKGKLEVVRSLVQGGQANGNHISSKGSTPLLSSFGVALSGTVLGPARIFRSRVGARAL